MSTKEKTICLSLVTKDVTNSVKTFNLSKRYVQRLLRIGTLNIIFQRIEIPESEFEPKNYENIPYVVYKRNSKNAYIRNYHVFIHGITDALEKDYLKEIFMYILDKKTGEALEIYNFKVKYNKDTLESKNKTLNKASEVKNATMEFLQALTNIPGEKWSSDKITLFMEFSYNEETPREYEPPNFEPADEPLCTSLHSNSIIQLGSINTSFHKVSAWGRGINFIQSRASTPAPSAVIEDILDVEEHDGNEGEKNEKRTVKNGNESGKKKLKTHHDESASSMINLTEDETNYDNITIASSEDLSCLCRWDLPKEFETTRCTKCYGIVHLACHGYISLNAVDGSSFLCYLCTNTKGTNSTSMNKLIKLRIVLYGIYIKKELPSELNLASKEDRSYILSQLEKLGVYNSKAKNKCDINFKKLSDALKTAFAIENSQYLE